MSTALSGAARKAASPGAGTATARNGAAGRALLVAALCAIAFLPFLLVARFPSQDGPAHVQTAGLLAMLQAGEAPAAARFVTENDPGFTNILAPDLLSLLLRVLQPAAAEWMLAFGITVLLFGAVLLGPGRCAGGCRMRRSACCSACR
jgi:hypothetical protein